MLSFLFTAPPLPGTELPCHGATSGKGHAGGTGTLGRSYEHVIVEPCPSALASPSGETSASAAAGQQPRGRLETRTIQQSSCWASDPQDNTCILVLASEF